MHALTPNSCQATEEIVRFGTLMNQCRTLKALRGSWSTSWMLLKPFHQLSWDQDFTVSPGWLQLFLWAQCQLLWKCLPLGYAEFAATELMRIQDLGVQNVPGDWLEWQQLWLGWAIECCNLDLSRTGKWASVCLLLPCVGRLVLWGQMRLSWMFLRPLSPFLQKCKCDRMSMLPNQLNAGLEKWIITLCICVINV